MASLLPLGVGPGHWALSHAAGWADGPTEDRKKHPWSFILSTDKDFQNSVGLKCQTLSPDQGSLSNPNLAHQGKRSSPMEGKTKLIHPGSQKKANSTQKSSSSVTCYLRQ